MMKRLRATPLSSTLGCTLGWADAVHMASTSISSSTKPRGPLRGINADDGLAAGGDIFSISRHVWLLLPTVVSSKFFVLYSALSAQYSALPVPTKVAHATHGADACRRAVATVYQVDSFRVKAATVTQRSRSRRQRCSGGQPSAEVGTDLKCRRRGMRVRKGNSGCLVSRHALGYNVGRRRHDR